MPSKKGPETRDVVEPLLIRDYANNPVVSKETLFAVDGATAHPALAKNLLIIRLSRGICLLRGQWVKSVNVEGKIYENSTQVYKQMNDARIYFPGAGQLDWHVERHPWEEFAES